MREPEVTVILITYNQRLYVEKTLLSILSQKTSFEFNVLIHDDFSDDGTSEIIDKYVKKHPDKIFLINKTERTFLKEGFNMMLFNHVVPHIKSKYIAYCDGDDYWIDESKLQKQFDYMQSHSEYSMCFHNAYQLERDGTMKSRWFIDDESDYYLSDFINEKPGCCVHTSSVFMLSSIFMDFPNWRKIFPVEDIPMYINAAIKGKVHRLSDIMSVYRHFADGSWSAQNSQDIQRRIDHIKKMIDAFRIFDSETKFEYHEMVAALEKSANFRKGLLEEDKKTIFAKENKKYFKRMKTKERIALNIKFKHPMIYTILRKNKKV